jgi:arabinofuranosyltransferase
LLACVPVGCHLVWRRVSTGDWLPCTYYAKTLGAWPESGVRYLASFLVEFGGYVWLACAVVWLVARVRSPGPLALVRRANLGASAVAAVFGYHFAYYTFYMGGDLFEWRVYTHLIPWLPLSLVVMLRASALRPGAVVAVFATWLVLALPIGWIKFAVDDEDVAPHLPVLLRPLVEPYDEWQRWLGDRAVCKRNHEMKVNLTAFVHAAPARWGSACRGTASRSSPRPPSACWAGRCRTSRSSTNTASTTR